MSRPIPRTVSTHRRGSDRPVACELLESRTLFSVHLQLNNGVLNVTEDFAGVNNSMIFELKENGLLEIDELTDTLLGNNALFNAGWTNIDSKHFTGPVTAISVIVIDLADGSDLIEIPRLNRPVVIQPSAAASVSVVIGNFQSDAQG